MSTRADGLLVCNQCSQQKETELTENLQFWNIQKRKESYWKIPTETKAKKQP